MLLKKKWKKEHDMLLRHTPTEVKERTALTVNPAKTCQPIGAMYAALGIHRCLPHSHGSQGCCAYHRSMLTRHYKEPVFASTSSFTEGSSVFGGQANMLQSITNIFSVYEPDVIAVHTTCLSETIGDDLAQITTKAREEGKIPEGKHVINASTPSYVGSHVTGFASMVKSMVTSFSKSTGQKENYINLIPGYVEPSDMVEVRRIADEMEIDTIMFPDTSGILNGPLNGKGGMYPEGGTTVNDLMYTGDAKATIALGPLSSGPAAKTLDTKCKVPCEILDIPVGLLATDRYVQKLSEVSGKPVPDSVAYERGQLVDIISDMHQYFYDKKVAVSADPDILIPLVEFLISVDMKPVHIVTGTPGKKILKRLKELTDSLPYDVNISVPGDLFKLHQWIKNEPVDLLIGNTYMKYIARDEDTPLIRYGFPIVDRVGHSYFPTTGYKGGIRLLEKILDAILDRKDRDSEERSFELVM
jgi:nitrogenase molybdenum-iron protein beta chain